MALLLWQLFSTFFIIGLFNFGGGGAMIPLIQTQVVSAHNWISETEFTDIVAISQTTPGPVGINCATYVGFEVFHASGYGMIAGIIGSAIATLAIVLPSFLIFFLIVKIFNRFHESRYFVASMTALKPAVAGLIGAAALILMFNISWTGAVPHLSLLKDNFCDWTSWVLLIGAFLLSYFKKVNPIALILASGVIGLIIY